MNASTFPQCLTLNARLVWGWPLEALSLLNSVPAKTWINDDTD